jgi:hypothetical protein
LILIWRSSSIYLHNAPLFTEQSWLGIYHFDA